MSDFDLNKELEWLRHLAYQVLVKQHETLCELQIIRTNQEKSMAAIDDLNTAFDKLKADVEAALAKNSDAAIAAVTAKVEALDAEVAPPAPAP